MQLIPSVQKYLSSDSGHLTATLKPDNVTLPNGLYCQSQFCELVVYAIAIKYDILWMNTSFGLLSAARLILSMSRVLLLKVRRSENIERWYEAILFAAV